MLNNNYSSKKLLQDFLIFEKENDLINWTIKNIPIWELIRINIFDKLTSNFIPGSIEVTDRAPKKIINGTREFLVNSLSKTPFKINKEYNFLILNHSRRKWNGEIYEDIYTDYFLNKLQHTDYVVLERFNNLSHLKPATTNNLYYLDIVEFPARFISKIPISVSLDEIENINRINQLIKVKWGITDIIDIRIIEKYIRYYKFLESKIERLVKKINPKCIIEVVSYAAINQIFTLIAKKNNIPVIELQHGTVGPYHIAYNFMGNPALKTFPDYFYAWGKYWVNIARLPISKKNIKIIGFPYIDSFRQKSSAPRKSTKQIVVVSQLRNDIAEFTAELAKLLPQYKIIFIAHPKEYSIANEKYNFLNKLMNVELINNGNKPLYNYFRQSDSVLGVYSTALIEALAFGSPIGIIKLPGWEYFEDLQESENIRFLKDANEAKFFITKYKRNTKFKTEEYFMSDSVRRLINELNSY